MSIFPVATVPPSDGALQAHSAGLPATIADDASLMRFSDVAKKDRALAERLQAVAQSLVRSGSTTSLDAIEHVTRRTLAAASPADATRFFSVLDSFETSKSRALVLHQQAASIKDTAKAVGTTLLDATLFPFISPALTGAAVIAFSSTPFGWPLVIGAGAATLVHGVASFTYYHRVKRWFH